MAIGSVPEFALGKEGKSLCLTDNGRAGSPAIPTGKPVGEIGH